MELLVLFDWFIGSKNCEIFLFVYLLMLRTPLEVVRLRGYFFLTFTDTLLSLSWVDTDTLLNLSWADTFHSCTAFFCILCYCTTRSLVVLQHGSLPFALLPISSCCQLFDNNSICLLDLFRSTPSTWYCTWYLIDCRRNRRT